MENNLFLSEMIRSELSEIVGPDFISVAESDKFIYSTDWAWMPQMWLDRGMQLRPPDYIVHPGSAEEISEILALCPSSVEFWSIPSAWTRSLPLMNNL
jgi:alkyldihydroxyacetonephosphate synthase